MTPVLTGQNLSCSHCGERCYNDLITINDNLFCCQGCKFVYELLHQNNLETYYQLDKVPGISPDRQSRKKHFAYLDNYQIKNRLLDYYDDDISRVTFFIPQIHCSSCIWLLENLIRLNAGVRQSRINFLKKELTVMFARTVSLRELVELLASIGYEPEIKLDKLDKKITDKSRNQLYTRLAVAGFCFANIMLFSFPEYLTADSSSLSDFRNFFSYLNILLSIPVFFYSSNFFFKSAYYSLKQKAINMDIPITLGIVILFSRSLFDILSGSGAGYMDSFTGLVFFLLIGKLYQKKTFDSLSFERDYKSYFPISVMRLDNNKEEIIMVTDLNIGDRIIIHNRELIPADTKLISPQAEIDYSFVTGETTPIKKKCGETIFAGGKLSGPAVQLEVIKNISQSYITQLWNNDAFDNNQSSILIPLSDKVSKYFTLTIITIAFLSALYWVLVDPSQAVNAATAVLIIACPCALALSTPFTLGTAMRILGKNKLYVKNSSVIEAIARTKSIIFDKTGTLTKPGETSIDFSGEPLSNYEKILIKSLVRHSTHPLSYNIYKQISGIKLLDVKSLYEEPGAGLEGIIDGNSVKIGSAKWINLKPSYYHSNRDSSSSRVYFSINNKVKGFFIIRNSYRDNLKSLISSLEQDYHLSLLSGDNTGERERLTSIFTNRAELLFEQSPYDKLEFVKKQQSEFKNVMMIGDGLNDTGALQQSDVGIAVCDSLNAFTPASDAIMDAEVFANLDKFIAFCKKSISIITISFAISFIFNIVGLSFAVRSLLSPLMAAVLMPLSSLSVVLFTTTATKWQAKRIGLK